MSDDHGERLARIEEGIKSLGRSLDIMRDEFARHTEEEQRLEQSVAEIRQELAAVKGGYKVFWQMCGAIAVATGAVWALATTVFKHG